MDSGEIKKVLEEHKLWIKTEGEKGKRASLAEESLYGEDLSNADLRFAEFSCINLEDANLQGANLMGADLSDSDLMNADFCGADLSGANLGGADLSGADLTGANLEGANLSGANLSGADLKGARLEFSSFPLWSGGVNVNIDESQAARLFYYLLKNIDYSKNIKRETKELFLKSDLVDKANEFSESDECGKVTAFE